MDKMKMESVDMTANNIEKIGKMFPNCITETKNENGKLKRSVNFEMLKQVLSSDVMVGDEAYEFTWVGKKASIVEANKPIRKSLRPCLGESKDWNTSKNLYIEGDNLEVLKLLQESYLGKVKMIYIDPPYNTGKDFVYPDSFIMDNDEYDDGSGYFNDDGTVNYKRQNSSSIGRYHSAWCSMIYSRLLLARNLLKEDGCIFISISDIEVMNLRKMCDEIFGDSNFVADLIWANKEGGGSSDSKLFRIKQEHILCYCNDIRLVSIAGISISNADRYKSSDEYESARGKYYLQKLGMGSIQYSVSLDYPIETPDGSFVMPSENNSGKKACWRWSKDKYMKNKEQGFVQIKKDTSGTWTVYTKQYMNCDNDGNIIERTQRPMGIIEEYSSTQASKLLEAMNMGGMFSYSKPISLIMYLVQRTCDKNDIVLDFFSGSATTAHAIMQLNAEDNGQRNYIMVQLQEQTEEKSEAYKNGYKNICEIGKERIRRAGDKIKSETGADIDYGFRVLKLDESNMKDVYYAPEDLGQQNLDSLTSNIKEDRTDLDLLFGCVLNWGIALSLPYFSEKISNCSVHTYGVSLEESKSICETIQNKRQVIDRIPLIACFNKNISEDVIKTIAKRLPSRVVFRDSSFANSPAKINVEEIFKLLSPDTIVKVI